MPDTMIQSQATDMSASVSCGVLSEYRSPLIGQLVVARAKATAEIKRIVKDKQAKVESRKEGGRSYSYNFADLADVMEAVSDALAANEMALFQTLQERGNGLFLVTTLAHSSDQWIASELRVTATDAGPQVFGSALTYARRYSALAILGIAPEQDDDGKAAQDRADQARQRPVQRDDRPRPMPASKPVQATPAASDEPEHMPIPVGRDGPLYGRWTSAALEVLAGKCEEWRRNWLVLHEDELRELREVRSDYADRIESVAISPDMPAEAAA